MSSGRGRGSQPALALEQATQTAPSPGFPQGDTGKAGKAPHPQRPRTRPSVHLSICPPVAARPRALPPSSPRTSRARPRAGPAPGATPPRRPRALTCGRRWASLCRIGSGSGRRNRTAPSRPIPRPPRRGLRWNGRAGGTPRTHRRVPMLPPPPAAPPRAPGPPERDGNRTRGLSQLQDGGASFNGTSRGSGAHRAPPIGRVGAQGGGGAFPGWPANPTSSFPGSAPFSRPCSAHSCAGPPTPAAGQRRSLPHPQLGSAAHLLPQHVGSAAPLHTHSRAAPPAPPGTTPGPRTALRPFVHREEPVRCYSDRAMPEVLSGVIAPAGRQGCSSRVCTTCLSQGQNKLAP